MTTRTGNKLLETLEYPAAEPEPSDLLFEPGKVIGAPVKVRRTGQDTPDEGWHIQEVYFKNSRKDLNQTLVKVCKFEGTAPKKGLQKVIPLRSLESINPEIRFLLFESDWDYVLYEDKEHGFKIGLIIDVNLAEKTLLVMLSPGGDDLTAPLERIPLESVIDKNSDPRKLEEIFRGEIKKRSRTSPDFETQTARQREAERKNLVYYLQTTDLATGKLLGHAVNISNQGFMLTADTVIASQTPFRLKLFLPKELQGSRYLEFSAVSRWCHPDENPEYHNTGFQFSDLPAAGRAIIRELIDKYCF
jgi:hypothetical protein